MTWTKLSDDFPDDCWTLTDQAFRLHVEALCWSNRKLLDCRIPQADLRRFAKHDGPEVVDELLGVGWWSEDGDVFVINHHALYQRSREQVVKRQEASKRNGRQGGRPPKPGREQTGGNPVGNLVANPQGQDRTGRDREVPETREAEVEDRLDEYREAWGDDAA